MLSPREVKLYQKWEKNRENRKDKSEITRIGRAKFCLLWLLLVIVFTIPIRIAHEFDVRAGDNEHIVITMFAYGVLKGIIIQYRANDIGARLFTAKWRTALIYVICLTFITEWATSVSLDYGSMSVNVIGLLAFLHLVLMFILVLHPSKENLEIKKLKKMKCSLLNEDKKNQELKRLRAEVEQLKRKSLKG
ncbi:MAG: hypothetical protein ACRBCT_09100 [Alphaproteobacteria bacterium]